MSLATRCTACGTIFRVVQDQLRVSEGWVRCGRCAEVFDAREQLFDIDREVPPPWPVAMPPAAPEPTPEPSAEPDWTPQHQEPHPAPATMPPDATTWVVPRELEPEPEPAVPVAQVDVPIEAPLFQSSAPAETFDGQTRREPYWEEAVEEQPTLELPRDTAVAPAAATTPDAPPLAPPSIEQDERPDVLIDARLAALAAEVKAHGAAPTDPQSEPEAMFLRQASSAARWQRPQTRLALALSALLLLALLLLQLGLQFRSAIAALYPPSTPLLQSLCSMTGCELQPWRRIDALAVENSSLTQAGSGNHYKLTVHLRNKAAYALALPWIDLSLTDAAGALVARRMLKPTDFNIAKASMGADGEEQLQLVFSTGKLKVSGYSVEIFHP